MTPVISGRTTVEAAKNNHIEGYWQTTKNWGAYKIDADVISGSSLKVTIVTQSFWQRFASGLITLCTLGLIRNLFKKVEVLDALPLSDLTASKVSYIGNKILNTYDKLDERQYFSSQDIAKVIVDEFQIPTRKKLPVSLPSPAVLSPVMSPVEEPIIASPVVPMTPSNRVEIKEVEQQVNSYLDGLNKNLQWLDTCKLPVLSAPWKDKIKTLINGQIEEIKPYIDELKELETEEISLKQFRNRLDEIKDLVSTGTEFLQSKTLIYDVVAYENDYTEYFKNVNERTQQWGTLAENDDDDVILDSLKLITEQIALYDKAACQDTTDKIYSRRGMEKYCEVTNDVINRVRAIEEDLEAMWNEQSAVPE